MGDWDTGTEHWGLTSALCPARQGVDSYSSLLKWRGRGVVSSHLAVLAGSELPSGILLLPASFVMVTAQLQAKLASQMPCGVDADSCPLSCPSHTCRPLLLLPFYRWAVVGLKLLGVGRSTLGFRTGPGRTLECSFKDLQSQAGSSLGRLCLLVFSKSWWWCPRLQGCAGLLSGPGERCLSAPCVCRVLVKVELSLERRTRKNQPLWPV